jgi:CRP-like cAMP-binding protein
MTTLPETIVLNPITVLCQSCQTDCAWQAARQISQTPDRHNVKIELSRDRFNISPFRRSAAVLFSPYRITPSRENKMTAPNSSENHATQNHLLAALPPEVFERLAPHLELIKMPLGEVLYDPGGLLQYAFFPTTAIVSLHYVLESGASAEIAGVGNEGVVGISLFMGGNTTPSLATVQTGGSGYRLKARFLMEEFNRSGGRRAGIMQNLLLRYTQALMTQMSQTAVCNRHHTVEQQLCRWLLSTNDRLPSNELTITQELIASMLGVRREGITLAAGNLQSAGLISYRRGHITVLDRAGLESLACECYSVVKKEFHRLLSQEAEQTRIR